jgi:adenylate cyclase
MAPQYTNSVEAWESFMRGTALYRHFTREDNAQARELFEKAIGLDPAFARAYANLAATHRQDWTFGWSQDLPASEQRAFELAQESVRRDPSLPYGHQQLAYLYVYRMQHDQAIAEAEQSVQLDPNYADGYAAWAQVLTYAGQPQEAIALMEAARRLNPTDPGYYPYHLGQAYYVIEEYEKAEKNLLDSLQNNYNFRPAHAYLAAVYIEQSLKKKEGPGKEAEELERKARAEMAILLSMGRPRNLFEDSRRVAPYKDRAITERLLAAWRQAEAAQEPPV